MVRIISSSFRQNGKAEQVMIDSRDREVATVERRKERQKGYRETARRKAGKPIRKRKE